MTNSFIQWNCRGLKPNFNELQLLINEHNPIAVLLQETFLKESDNITLKGFTLVNKIHSGGERASGGVSIIINNLIPHRILDIDTNLQAVAVSLSLPNPLTICSIYLPPNIPLDTHRLDSLITQLPAPFILFGDFNSHNYAWGCKDTNDRGNIIYEFIARNTLCLLNNPKSNTYFHQATGKFSAIDLTLCSPQIFLDFNWQVKDDTFGSDHFPIVLEQNGPPDLVHNTKWKLNKADWELFQVCCEQTISESLIQNEDPAKVFTTLVHAAAEKSIPKTSAKSKRPPKPWFTEECKEAISKRKAALNRFNNHPTKANLEHFRIFRAKARRTVSKSKKASWRQYVSKLNSRTSTKKTWDMIRKISGKHSQNPISQLKKADGEIAQTPKDIADTLASHFREKSSSDTHSDTFINHKKLAEKEKLNFNSDNTESYNSPFTLKELRSALDKAHNTCPGPDDIHYQILKHLPTTTLQILLDIYNCIWTTGVFPESWREALVIPIPKQGKQPSDPNSYRPIALTSCVCKVLERMINNRLVWFLESNNLITANQNGFRKHRSTLDHLIRFESFIREAFVKKEHEVSIFFDLESAYDTTWKYGVMKDLHDFGLRGRLANFISAFLNDRNFKVRVGTTLSDKQNQEMGVPQGCILSVTLFTIKINSIVKSLQPDVECSLYVDDFLICFRSKHMHTIERQLQLCLNKLQIWADTNGFKFSKSKTKCMHFCQLRQCHLHPELTLGGTKIECVDEFKFLGLVFDRKLNFKAHIQYLLKRCTKALNLLKVVAHTDWGADRTVLLRLYRTLIRSKLDYGCIVYGSTRKSYLQKLDTIHHQGLRIATGAFRTSPVCSLYAEANEPSLYLRRKKLSLQYTIKLKSNPTNPAYQYVFNPMYRQLFIKHPRVIPPFGIRIGPDIQSIDLDLEGISENRVSEIPPWEIQTPTVLLDLTTIKKSWNVEHEFLEKYNAIKEQYTDYSFIYTDGSKDGNNVSCATVTRDETYRIRLPDDASIFTAEITAIDMALDHIFNSEDTKFVIVSDSLSSLLALKSSHNDNPLVLNLLQRISELSTDNTVIFCWVPSHIGIHGNEQADKAAKSALQLEMIFNIFIPASDFKPCIQKHINNVWQESWTSDKFNKLRSIMPVLGSWSPAPRQHRREEIVITRCRIGHSRLTQSYLFEKSEQPECVFCFAPYTIQHILIDCVDLSLVRQRHFIATDMKSLFQQVCTDSIIDYLKEINVYHKL